MDIDPSFNIKLKGKPETGIIVQLVQKQIAANIFLI